MSEELQNAVLVDDAGLGNGRTFTPPSAGAPFLFDESYRRAHLPLIAPDHPRVIAEDKLRGYVMGRHRMIYSAVLPVPADFLDRAPAFQALDAALRATIFAKKIDWDLLARRGDALHATVCGSLSQDILPVIADETRQRLSATGPFTVELRGIFSGDMNVGRLYLPLYPERRAGQNMVHAVQAAFGRSLTDMYLVGLYNFRDELTMEESAALRAFLMAWQGKPLLRYRCEDIWILGSRDDLVLERVIAEKISLK